MQWIHQYQLFLFDFDGLLVNTESLHFQAYQHMCAARGFPLNWNFERYSDAAHHHATGLRDRIYAEFPALYAQEPDWSVLYAEKKKAFLNLLKAGAAELMPGAANLLLALKEANIKRCVVTHSSITLIQTIRHQNPILDSIPHWLTREDYSNPKPDPECYQTAIQRLAQNGDRIIGFEDSPRGLNALLQSSAKPVLICPQNSPYLKHLLKEELAYYPSFTAINDDDHP